MKTEKTQFQPLTPLQAPPTSDGVAQVEELKPVADQQRRLEIDAHEKQPIRLNDGAPASSVADAGANVAVQVRKQQRSSGVRTKKLKTEQVGSMPRIARQAFNGVHEVVGQARQVLETKPRRTESRE